MANVLFIITPIKSCKMRFSLCAHTKRRFFRVWICSPQNTRKRNTGKTTRFSFFLTLVKPKHVTHCKSMSYNV